MLCKQVIKALARQLNHESTDRCIELVAYALKDLDVLGLDLGAALAGGYDVAQDFFLLVIQGCTVVATGHFRSQLGHVFLNDMDGFERATGHQHPNQLLHAHVVPQGLKRLPRRTDLHDARLVHAGHTHILEVLVVNFAPHHRLIDHAGLAVEQGPKG